MNPKNTVRSRALCMFDLRSGREPARQALDESDHLIGLATRGDPDAIAAVALAMGPILLEEVRGVPAASRAGAAEDVVQDFVEALLRRNVPAFRGGRGDGIPFLRRTIRAMARLGRGKEVRHAAR